MRSVPRGQSGAGRLRRRAVLAGLLSVSVPLPACSAAGALLADRPTVRVAVTWSAAELSLFRRVIDDLRRLPGEMAYDVDILPYGDDISAALATRGAGRPDVVLLPRPGLVAEHLDALAPLPAESWPAPDTYPPVWRSLLFHRHPQTGEQVPYGLPFKVAHKSLVWYRPCQFERLGLQPPQTWSDWLALNTELSRQGIPALALGGGDGWMLTDFFENVLLGHSPCTYDALSGPAPRPWHVPAVREAFRSLGQMWSTPGVVAGGVRRALVQQFSDAVLEVFRYHRAAMVVAPDFAWPIIERFGIDPDGCDNPVGTFAFPPPRRGQPPLVAGGDVVVLTRPARPEARDLLTRLVDSRAVTSWIRAGGFVSPDLTVPERLYPPDMRPVVRQLVNEPFRFDLSDQIGAVGGQEGLWRVLQQFLTRVGDRDTAAVDVAADEAVAQLLALEDATVGRDVSSTWARLRASSAEQVDLCEPGAGDGG
ncbi:carbohydrate ABC transporter substrate-binding protein (CUT1 family) [Thermasporomyces composti]|jgi:alpha-glucoside transport system substrate-binding protein|uniref:Carbohydrate ABC transporter substrate-binding protein (CUT1 family) n=1 Tax=Thermasporomyces composti TaxID=696763 RepID=A0A3D9V3X5_THECX|nr:carbohydrate ABC transporter substrate-binding protein (CUT1 family) [Thermasporomyces composti]